MKIDLSRNLVPFLVILGGSALLLISFGIRHSFGLYLLPISNHISAGREIFGFAAAFFVYVTVNMAMVLGLLPIVGAPLPIMSYGGSSMLSVMIGLGIVMSCKIHQQEEVS